MHSLLQYLRDNVANKKAKIFPQKPIGGLELGISLRYGIHASTSLSSPVDSIHRSIAGLD
jgi:hypothetical protein